MLTLIILCSRNLKQKAMKKLKVVRIVLFLAAIIAIGVGAGQVFVPVAFEASAGIQVVADSNLLSEMRAAGGALLAAGVVIISGVFISRMTFISIVLSALFYLSYGVSRLLGMVLDGMPGESLVIVTGVEIVVGVLSLMLLYRFQNEAVVKAT